MSSALNSHGQLALMLCARAGNPLGDHFSLFCDEAVQSLLVFVVDVNILPLTKPAFTLLL